MVVRYDMPACCKVGPGFYSDNEWWGKQRSPLTNSYCRFTSTTQKTTKNKFAWSNTCCFPIILMRKYYSFCLNVAIFILKMCLFLFLQLSVAYWVRGRGTRERDRERGDFNGRRTPRRVLHHIQQRHRDRWRQTQAKERTYRLTEGRVDWRMDGRRTKWLTYAWIGERTYGKNMDGWTDDERLTVRWKGGEKKTVRQASRLLDRWKDIQNVK